MEYGNEIWDNCQQYEKDDFEKSQIEASRIATGTTKFVSVASLYSKIGLNILDTRRKKQKLVLFYKMVNQLTSLYLSFLLPPTVKQHLDIILETQILSLQLMHEQTSITTPFSFLQ